MMMSNRLGLYIHIPFCVQKCNYCDFLSYSHTTSLEQESYVECLIHEMASCQDRYTSYIVDTIFIGGGTPSILDIKLVTRIFQAIKKYFQVQEKAEISIECNPGTIQEDKLREYFECGINRLSLGLQSAQDEELKLLGRIHTFREFDEGINLAKRVGFKNINIDIMAGIPGQTIHSYQDTCKKVINYQPEHISAYSLIVEEGTPFYQKYHMEPPVNEETDREMYHFTKQWFQEQGYCRYEISNYAKEGYSCMHNRKYWECKNYLGLGLGAVSRIGRLRYTNARNFSEYKNGKQYKEKLTREDCIEEYMFLGLREIEGISKNKFQTIFKSSISDVYGNLCDKLVEQELLMEEEDKIYLTERGLDISNYVMSEFILTC